MLTLTLLRHGAAEDVSPAGDRGRRLTARGRDDVTAVARFLARAGWSGQALVSSPYLRAVETAALVGGALALAAGDTDDELAPHGDATAIAARLLARRQSLVVVSHLPLLPALVGVLTGAPCALMIDTAHAVRLAMIGRDRAAITGFIGPRDVDAAGG